MHKVPSELLAQQLRIHVIGAGGNGSMLLPHLARIQKSLLALGRTSEIEVTVWDDDAVTKSNLGRQAYSAADLGRNKAAISVTRINLFFGLDWKAQAARYSNERGYAEIVISCVDNLATRKELAKENWSNRYWLDLGNGDTFGQVVLGGCGLPTLFDRLPHLKRAAEDKTTPSCSVAEALARQDLFINSTLANFAGQLLWTMLRKGQLEFHGYYINLASGRVAPLPVPDDANTEPPQSERAAPRILGPANTAVDVRRRGQGHRTRAVR